MIGSETGAAPRYDWTFGAILIADPPRAVPAAEAIVDAGGRVMLNTRWNAAAAAIGMPIGARLILVETEGVDEETLDDVLPSIAAQSAMPIVVMLDEARIDLVSAHLFDRNVQLLCRPTAVERVAALTIAGGARLGAHVGESGHDIESTRLRRLNEEVARIAETLARLTRDDSAVPDRPLSGVGDRRRGYGPPPAADTVGAQDIRQAIRARRMRAQFFEESLFEDPAWDMLLDLYAAELERAQVSVSSLCIAASVAPTTALRWIAKMTEMGLFARHPDPFDRRRAFMALSEVARDGMRNYFAAARRAGLSIA